MVDYSADFEAAGLKPVPSTTTSSWPVQNTPVVDGVAGLPDQTVSAKLSPGDVGYKPQAGADSGAPAGQGDYSDDFKAAGLVPIAPPSAPAAPALPPSGGPAAAGAHMPAPVVPPVPGAPPAPPGPAAAAPEAPVQEGPSNAKVLMAGLAQGGWGALAAIPNATNWLFNLPIKGINAATGADLPTLSTDVAGDVSRVLAGATGGLSPYDVHPEGIRQRALMAMAQAPGLVAGFGLGGAGLAGAAGVIGEALPALAGVAKVAGGVGQTMAEAPAVSSVRIPGTAGLPSALQRLPVPSAMGTIPVAVGQAGQSIGEDLSPEWAKPYVGMFANMGLTGLTAGLAMGTPAAIKVAGDVLQRVGVGKQSFPSASGPVRATPRQAAAVGQEINTAAGGGDLLLKLQTQAAIRGRIVEIDNALADPKIPQADADALRDERRLLVPESGELVPGARPTLAQVAGLPGGPKMSEEQLSGLTGYETGARLKNKEAFIAAEGRNNSKRLAALRGQADQGADTKPFGDHYTQRMADLETATQEVVADATRKLRETYERGDNQQEQHEAASALRNVLAAARAVQDRMMKDEAAAIDPDGTARFDIGPAISQGRATLDGIKMDFPEAVQRIGEIDHELSGLLHFGSKEGLPLEMRQRVEELERERIGYQAMIDTGATLHPAVEKMARALAGMQRVIPLRAHQVVRSNISKAIQEVAANQAIGVHSPAMAQLMGMKAAMDRSLAEAVDRAVGKGGPKVGKLIDDLVSRAERDVEPAVMRVPKEPTRLTDFIKANGGIQDPGGDVLAMIGGRRFARGLINARGMTQDDLAHKAWEQGYFPEHTERPDINALLDKLASDIRGAPQYSYQDAAEVTEYNRVLGQNDEVDRLAHQHGIDPAKMSRKQFYDAVAAKVSAADEQRIVDTAAAGANASYEAAVRDAADEGWAEYRPVHDEGAPRTQEDLERELEQEHDANPAAPGAAGGQGSGAVGGGAAPVQGGGGQAGRGAGAAGGGAAQGNGTQFPGENISPEVAKRGADFLKNYAQFKRTYDEGAVGNVLATDRFGTDRLPDIDAAKPIFRRGKVDPAAVEQFKAAVGGDEAALQLARNYLASELRFDGIVDPATGVLNKAKFATWARGRMAAAKQLGGNLAQQIGDHASAQDMYDKAVADQGEAIKKYQSGQTAQVLKAVAEHGDPVQVVERAMASNDPTKLSELVRQTAGNKDAREGLKRMVVDWVDREMQSAVKSGEDENLLASKKFRDKVARFDTPIEALFGRDGADVFRNVAEDMNAQGQKTTATPGSPTVPYGIEAIKHAAVHHSPTAMGVIAGTLLGHVAEHVVGVPFLGEGGLMLGSVIGRGLQQAGIKTEADLRKAALLDPSGLGRLLLERVKPGEAPSMSLMKRIGQRVQVGLAVNAMRHR